MDSFKICLIGILCVFLCMLFAEMKSSFSLSVKIACSVLVFLFAIGIFSPLIDFFRSISGEGALSSYLPLMLKALGITLCSDLVSDICRDSGNTSLASGIELVGKAEILLLSLPLIKEMIGIAEGVLP